MMNKHVIAGTASLLMLAATSLVFASDIYKWTDLDGTVHYGDRPAEGAQPERLAIASRPTDPASVQAMTQARAAARAEAAANKAAEAAAATDPQADAADRAEKCAKYRQQMQTLVSSRRVYREDEAGERVYLDEEETLATRQRVEDNIDKYCTP